MTPAVPREDLWLEEEMTPSGSDFEEGFEEMTRRGRGSRRGV